MNDLMKKTKTKENPLLVKKKNCKKNLVVKNCS